MSKKKRVLFVAEAVTLAHVARPYVLAKGLSSEEYEVHFAWHPRYASLFGPLPFEEHHIKSIEPESFMLALAKGAVLYQTETLNSYVKEDLGLLEAVKPDLIVGDFRLSLSVSARVAGIPYIALSNAYWCPNARQDYPVPDLPITRYMGVGLGQMLFNIGRPIAFVFHAIPLNRVRKKWGLPAIGYDLRKVYTDADYSLYCDEPSLFGDRELPPGHEFIGPVTWSPDIPLPLWWHSLPTDKPVVYVNLGSSGPAEHLEDILRVLSGFDVTTIACHSGASGGLEGSDRLFLADYLPNDAAMARADLIICNGGSMSTYQAYAQTKPVICIPGNLDQFLNTQAGVDQELCTQIRTQDIAHSDKLTQTVGTCLESSEQPEMPAKHHRTGFSLDARTEFRRVLDQALG